MGVAHGISLQTVAHEALVVFSQGSFPRPHSQTAVGMVPLHDLDSQVRQVLPNHCNLSQSSLKDEQMVLEEEGGRKGCLEYLVGLRLSTLLSPGTTELEGVNLDSKHHHLALHQCQCQCQSQYQYLQDGLEEL